MSQPMVSQPPPIPEFALKFYDLDHRLTKEDRITLRDYFKSICNKTLVGSWLMFGAGFGLVYLKNRTRISNATKAIDLLKKQFPEITNEELVKKSIEMRITRPNTFGAQGFFAGIASMMLSAPFIGSYVTEMEYENLVKKETGDSTASISSTNSDIDSYDEDNAEIIMETGSTTDANTHSGNLVVQVAKLLSQSGAFIFKWQYYYDLTAQKPEFIIRDPRERYKQLQARYQDFANHGNSGKPPLTTNRYSTANGGTTNTKGTTEFASDPSQQQQEMSISTNNTGFSSSSTPYNNGESSQNSFTNDSGSSDWYSGADSDKFSNDSTANDNDEFDIGNIGLGASESNSAGTTKKYQSAWDKIRDENGEESSWNNIRKN